MRKQYIHYLKLEITFFNLYTCHVVLLIITNPSSILFIVNGNYTVWSNWSSCSMSCGPGQQLRRRNCTQPKPAHGGDDCEGPRIETKECFIEMICPGRRGISEYI